MWPRLILATLLLAGTARAQTATDISTDPHFSPLLQNGQVRVYSLVLRPQERSYVHIGHNSLLLTLQRCELVMWPQGASDITSFQLAEGVTNFFFAGRDEGFRNPLATAYRGVWIEFLNPRVTTYGYQWQTGSWDFGYSSAGSPVDPHARFTSSNRLGAVTVIASRLLPGDPVVSTDANVPELLVPITSIDLKGGSSGPIHASPGEVQWFPDGHTSRYANASNQAARLLLIEFDQPLAEQH